MSHPNPTASHAQQQRLSTVKVGLLTVISLALLVGTVIWLRGRSFNGGPTFEVQFQDIDGLREAAPVQMMGIRVGFVDTIEPLVTQEKTFRVKVKFVITDPRVEVQRGSVITLEQSGIIGEKFLEITPPRPHETSLRSKTTLPALKTRTPIVVRFKDKLETIGFVNGVQAVNAPLANPNAPQYLYQISYTLNQPGYALPPSPKFDIQPLAQGKMQLVMIDPSAQWINSPDKNAYFTLQEPMRLKDFLQEQLASAKALRITNEKINQILTDDTILSLQGTAKQMEQLTAEATTLITQARAILKTTSGDVHQVVQSVQTLTGNVNAMTSNINQVIGDPKTQQSLKETIQSINAASTAMADVLNDPNLKTILADTKVTSENAAELVKYLKATAVDNDLQGRLNQSMTLLNTSLSRLSNVLKDAEEISSEKQTIRSILVETKETTQNLNQFSKKINKHFALFRLLF